MMDNLGSDSGKEARSAIWQACPKLFPAPDLIKNCGYGTD
jgi:hypothetical protein